MEKLSEDQFSSKKFFPCLWRWTLYKSSRCKIPLPPCMVCGNRMWLRIQNTAAFLTTSSSVLTKDLSSLHLFAVLYQIMLFLFCNTSGSIHNSTMICFLKQITLNQYQNQTESTEKPNAILVTSFNYPRLRVLSRNPLKTSRSLPLLYVCLSGPW